MLNETHIRSFTDDEFFDLVTRGYFEFTPELCKAAFERLQAFLEDYHEIKEELGADIAVDRFLCTVEYQYEAFLLVMDCYVCHVVSGMITITEHIAMKWLDGNTIDSVEWLPADLAVLPYVRSLFNDAK